MGKMIKNGRCTKFELDESTGRCKHYGGSLEHLAACYTKCKKRKISKKDKNKIALEQYITGVIIE
ncbi:hypothetical protein [Terrisporobacter sp.]|uniref:hypothetical protein n=1 Tax=Terrisporobacter sp. TaxID=1965305 RepID=UPI00289E8F7E|nr:hypothetical protein [Terrisporobacter sp.]